MAVGDAFGHVPGRYRRSVKYDLRPHFIRSIVAANIHENGNLVAVQFVQLVPWPLLKACKHQHKHQALMPSSV